MTVVGRALTGCGQWEKAGGRCCQQSRAGGYMQLAQVLCYKLYNRAECFRAGWQGKHFATVKIADFSKLNQISIAVYSVQRAVCVLDSVQMYKHCTVLAGCLTVKIAELYKLQPEPIAQCIGWCMLPCSLHSVYVVHVQCLVYTVHAEYSNPWLKVFFAVYGLCKPKHAFKVLRFHMS